MLRKQRGRRNKIVDTLLNTATAAHVANLPDIFHWDSEQNAAILQPLMPEGMKSLWPQGSAKAVQPMMTIEEDEDYDEEKDDTDGGGKKNYQKNKKTKKKKTRNKKTRNKKTINKKQKIKQKIKTKNKKTEIKNKK